MYRAKYTLFACKPALFGLFLVIALVAAACKPPTATSASITTAEDTPSNPVTPSVTDPDLKDTHTFTIVTQPANGVATVVANQLVYTPNANFNGTDSFTFRATDPVGFSVVGTASVTVVPVDDAPAVANVDIVTAEDTQSAPITPSVSDPDSGETYTFAIETQPQHGSATIVDNQLVYMPNANFNGQDGFSFRVTDSGGLSAIGTANVTVTPVNDAPTMTSAVIITAEDTQSAPVTPTVADPDVGDSYIFAIETQPGRGSATVAGNQLVYTPDADFSGQDSFTFRATDAGGLWVVGTANVTVTPVNDAPVATQAGITARIATASGGITPYVDDADVWETFIYQVLASPVHGSASVVGNKLVYVPGSGFSGLDNFTYRVTDSGGQTIDGTALVRVYSNTNFSRCTSPSVFTTNSNGTLNITRTNAGTCSFYGEVVTRTAASGDPVTVKYVVHRPSNGASPKAAVFLIAGSDLDINVVGDATTGVATTGGNFLVRTAQLFAEAGYLAIAMNQPSDQPSPGSTDATTDVDHYRVSVDHAIDILAVLKQVNTDNLDVFLSGTSRGAMSVVASNLIATGISISSPVTRGSSAFPGRLYVNDPDYPSLQPNFVQRPVHVLWNQNDGCPFSRPADSQTLYNNLAASGIAASFSIASGGFNMINADGSITDSCGAMAFHGYLGIEPTAVSYITTWLNGRVAALAGNKRPDAAFAKVATAAGVPKQIDLTTLTRDLDSDTLSYALSHATTSRGGSVSLRGAMATYISPAGASNVTDYFVYVVTDGNGGVNAAVVTIQIGG